MLFLLFTSDADCLGEIVTQGGALSRCMLSEAGERKIGSQVERWQTEGLPMNDGGHVRRVMPRSAEFTNVLQLWAVDQGYGMVALPPSRIPAWEMLSTTGIDAPERYHFLLDLVMLSDSAVPAWEERIAAAAKSKPRTKKRSAPQKKKALR